MEIVSFEAEIRERNKKKGAKAVRNAGLIPAVLYGGMDPLHFSVNVKDVKSLIYTGNFKLAKITVDGKECDCIVKTVQFHPVTDQVMHIDFLRLIEGTPLKVEIPVRFHGVSPGVKEGGQLMQSLRRIKVKTTPENLVDEVLVDISGIELGQSFRIRDLEVGEELTILNPPGTPIASVKIPRVLKDLEEEEEEETGLPDEDESKAKEGEDTPKDDKN